MIKIQERQDAVARAVANLKGRIKVHCSHCGDETQMLQVDLLNQEEFLSGATCQICMPLAIQGARFGLAKLMLQ